MVAQTIARETWGPFRLSGVAEAHPEKRTDRSACDVYPISIGSPLEVPGGESD